MKPLLASVALFSCLVGHEEASEIAWSWHYQNGKRSTASKVEQQPPSPSSWPEPYRINIRHIEGKGIGYDKGYTSLEGTFFFPQGSSWAPFIDLRGHLFNNQQVAANGGLGFRYVSSLVWGLNIYYDFRQTSHLKYHQASLGFEMLGKVWDFRWSGYLPLCRKTTPFYDAKFHSFSGNHLKIKRKREFALAGSDAEVGFHVKKFNHATLYIAAGPYYYTGHDKHLWGGQIRGMVEFLHRYGIEGNFSYDPVFGAIGQGQFRLMFALGSKKKTVPQPKASMNFDLREHAMQKIQRQEIVVLDHETSYTIAGDPATGSAYTFMFVSNQSSAELGTFEAPAYSLSLIEASSKPGDIIYLFSGDGSDLGMKNGFTLKKDQQLLGSGVSHLLKTDFGDVKIPAYSTHSPCITNRSAPLREPLIFEETSYIKGVEWKDLRTWLSGSSPVSSPP